jgi:polyhydroxyalkanoate synthesis regulator phasin
VHEQTAESAADRFQHRQRRIKEAVARGDITPEEGQKLLKEQQDASKQSDADKTAAPTSNSGK